MELRHLHTLVVLAEERHFGRAARRLHVVQSAVTRTLQALEVEVGTVLFDRDTRRVLLTPAGEVLVKRARALLLEAEKAARECRDVGEGKIGVLRIALAGLSGVGCLPEALRVFREKHPTIDIELCRMNSAMQVSALSKGEIDLALTHTPLADEKVSLDPVEEQSLYTILPEDHALAKSPSAPWSALEDETHIVLSRAIEPEVFRTFGAQLGALGIRRPKMVEVDDIGLMFTLVAAGLGVSHVPEDMIRIGFQGVVAIPTEPLVALTLYAARSKEHGSPFADALFASLVGSDARRASRQ